jgi:hypothetical protein
VNQFFHLAEFIDWKASITKVSLSLNEVKHTQIRKGAVRRLFGSRIPFRPGVNDLLIDYALQAVGYPDPGYIVK